MLKIPNKDAESGGDTNLLDTAEEIPYDHMQRVLTASMKDIDETTENQPVRKVLIKFWVSYKLNASFFFSFSFILDWKLMGYFYFYNM